MEGSPMTPVDESGEGVPDVSIETKDAEAQPELDTTGAPPRGEAKQSDENEAKADSNGAVDGSSDSKAQLQLVQAAWEDFSIGHSVYVRDKKAEIRMLDYPLVYWVYEGETSEKHRSFIFDEELFKVEIGARFSEKVDMSSIIDEPLCSRIYEREDEDDVEVEGATPKHTVEIKSCKNTNISILDEVYGIHMVDCKNVTVLFNSLIASCEMTNCSNCKLFCMTECCLFDIQDSTSNTICIGIKLLNTVLFSTIKTEGSQILAYKSVTTELCERIKDGEEIESLIEYKIPAATEEGESYDDGIELRTKWTEAEGFETKVVETKELSPSDFENDFDPF